MQSTIQSKIQSKIQYNKIQCKVQYKVQYKVKYNTIKYKGKYNTKHNTKYNTKYNAKYNANYNANYNTKYNKGLAPRKVLPAEQYNNIQYNINTMQYNTINRTIQYDTILIKMTHLGSNYHTGETASGSVPLPTCPPWP
jgi:hypothetical protein